MNTEICYDCKKPIDGTNCKICYYCYNLICDICYKVQVETNPDENDFRDENLTNCTNCVDEWREEDKAEQALQRYFDIKYGGSK